MAAESSKKAVCPWLEADAEDEVVDTELGDFEQAIRKLFKSQDYGIALQSKRKFHKKYKNAFEGKDAVDWIVLHASCSREKAVKIGRLWEAQGDFEHVEKSQKFADDNNFYRFIGNEEKVASLEDVEKSFAMQRERVAAAVEKHRELDDQYNANHHLLNACTVDDLALVKYLIMEEGCDIEYAFPEQRPGLNQKQSQMSVLLSRLIKPGDTPLKVAEKYDSIHVRIYLNGELNQRKKKQKSSKGGLMDSIMGNFFGSKSSEKKAPPPEVKLSGSIQVNRSEVNLIEVLGTGLYATVWRAQCRGTMVAVKVMKDITRDMREMVPEIIQEMSSLRSPDISSLIGVCVEDEEVMFIMELMTGNLRKLLQSRVPLSLPLRLRMALDACTGMQYLHGSNVSHGDIKSSNVLYEQVGDDYVVRISDFGLAKLFSSKIKAIGTPFYTAPEVLSGGETSKESDIYSFGILLYEIISRKQPFGNYDNYEVFKKALISQSVRPSIPQDCPASVAELVNQCWDQNPAKRPSFTDIKTRLWDIVVELSIPDPAGAHFWTKFITDKEKEIFRDSISWDDFSITFCSFLDEKAVPLPADVTQDDIPNATVGQMYELCARGPAMRQIISKVLQAKNFKSFAMWAKDTVNVHTSKSVYWNCFKELLLKGDTVKQVHIENFGAVCNAFGPCVVTAGGDTVAGGFLDRIKKAMESGMFFGTISVKNSLNLLKGKEPGAYLVRMTPTGEFCISRINREREILHYKAFRDVKTNTYGLDQDASGEKYASLVELVEGVKMKLRLFNPCAATPFSHIFVDETETPVNYMMADY